MALIKREESYAQSKTWQQTSRETQEDIKTGQRLSRHQVEALSIGEGVRRTRVELCLHRTQVEEARFSQLVDRSHRRGRSSERSQLLAAHAWTEARRHRARSQSARGSRGASTGVVCRSRRSGQECA